MSMLDRYIANHTKVYWDVDKKEEKALWDRRGIAEDFQRGNSLPHILDVHPSEPKYQRVKGEKDWAAMVFAKPINRPLRCERPCVDDSILWLDPGTKEAVGITYRKETLYNQSHHYWGCEDDE